MNSLIEFMPEVTEETIKHVARIARLELTEEEIKKFTGQLKNVLDNFKLIDEVDTKDVKPSFHPQEIKNVMREDTVKKWEWEPLTNTKHKEDKHFKGPRIV
jgi:aspartyl-tRNA(Asn)/glutamyl-tRNA(Gln) amidotransferase subunit C